MFTDTIMLLCICSNHTACNKYLNLAIVHFKAHTLINDAVTRAVGEFNVILGDISDFVDISNNKTAIEAVQRFSKVLETTITYALCIAIKATVRNVLETNGQKNGEPNGQSGSSSATIRFVH